MRRWMYRAVCAGWLLSLPCLPVGAQDVPPPTTTLWNFLGIPQALNKIHANTFNRRGNRPGLEKKPPLLKIADPANLKSDVPAIKAAAEIKQAEDLKPQKIKAIKYLATIGCGCYDKDEKVTKALLAAMEDCTEDVRLEAVRAISMAASGERCSHCKQQSCCNEKITAQLYKIAYELDDLGCHVEPSERVRAAAIEALGICCPGRVPVTAPEEATPVEGVDQPAPVEGVTPADAPPAPPATPETASAQPTQSVDPNHFLQEASLQAQSLAASRPAPTPAIAPAPPAVPEEVADTSITSPAEPAPALADAAPAPTPATVDREHREAAAHPAPPAPPSSRRSARIRSSSYTATTQAASAAEAQGVVAMIDGRRNMAHIHFHPSQESVPVGSRLRVLVTTSQGTRTAGEVEVVQSFPGSATVRGLGELNLTRIGRDAVIVR